MLLIMNLKNKCTSNYDHVRAERSPLRGAQTLGWEQMHVCETRDLSWATLQVKPTIPHSCNCWIYENYYWLVNLYADFNGGSKNVHMCHEDLLKKEAFFCASSPWLHLFCQWLTTISKVIFWCFPQSGVDWSLQTLLNSMLLVNMLSNKVMQGSLAKVSYINKLLK